jgi:hypothetical protein
MADDKKYRLDDFGYGYIAYLRKCKQGATE